MSRPGCEQARGCWDCPERARLDALVAAGADTLRGESERLREAEAEITRLQVDLARARWALDDLRRRVEWDDLEGDP
jgi:hypothetical protein